MALQKRKRQYLIDLETGWNVLGWCLNDDLGIMARKEGSEIAIMFETPNFEECWFHANKLFLDLIKTS